MSDDVLLAAGLTETEARTYRALCKLGSSTGYAVAKETGLYKANTYDALKKLERQGIVAVINMDGKDYYEAADPAAFLRVLDRRKEELEAEIPRLRAMQLEGSEGSAVTVLKGRAGMYRFLFSLLEQYAPIYTWGVPKDTRERIGPRIEDFHELRISRKIKFYHIYNHEATARVEHLRSLPYTPVRRLMGNYDSKVITMVCGDAVGLLHVLNEPIKVVRIVDADLADAYRKYFDLLWKQAERFPEAKS